MITEGYFVEYKGIIWSVKGCFHPEGYVVALPRKISEIKIKRLSDAMKLVRERFPFLLRFVKEIGFEVPLIPLEESKILDPFKVKVEDAEIGEFISYFKNVGITGSMLYEGKGNDIDLISFDPDNYNVLKVLRERKITLPLLDVNVEEIETLSAEDFSRLKQNRVLEGVYKGLPYTFKIVQCEDFGEVISQEEFNGVVEINKALKPYTIPVKYLDEKRNLVITSFRTRFTELSTSTKLYVKGKILHRSKFDDLDLDIAEVVKIL